MFDLCLRAYSNYLKYNTKHDYSKKIAKFSIFLMLSFVCFVFSEECGMVCKLTPLPFSLQPTPADSRIS